MPVRFEVTCDSTQPGEAVFAVGDDISFGGWDETRGRILVTSSDRWPVWSTAEDVSLVGALKYKFVVGRVDRSGGFVWEDMKDNRFLEPTPDADVVIKASWNEPGSSVLVAGEGAPAEPAEASGRAARTHGGIGARGRNFSSSLLTGLIPDGEDLEPEELEADATAEDGQMPRGTTSSDAGAEGAEGGGMRRVGSLSVFSFAADPEEKAAARLRRPSMGYTARHVDVPVVVVSSEITPWSKSGGLGMVAASLAYEFSTRGHRTMAVSPMYADYEGARFVGETRVWLEGCEHLVKYFHIRKDWGEGHGCDFVFVGHESYKRPQGMYHDTGTGQEYGDNLFRFALLSLASMEAPLILRLNDRPPLGDRVCFLANDWQAGMVPVSLCHKYRKAGTYREARSIYVVHNLGYQGQYSAKKFPPGRTLGLDEEGCRDVTLGNTLNLSKAAIVCCDRLIAVSPNYAIEIQDTGGGFGLHEFCKGKGDALRLAGILNGIDDSWDPRRDHHIAVAYSSEAFAEGKAHCKAELQRQMNLRQATDVVLLGFVGRLSWQKGVDVLTRVVPWMMEDTGNGVTGRVQVVLMGQGDPHLSEQLRHLEGRYPGRVCGYVGFDPVVEHRMMAGCDLLVMPSRYEPCGLPQMYCQAYGTLPVVTATGGLKDTVQGFGHGHGVETATGFHVWPLGESELKRELYIAFDFYLNKREEFLQMQTTAINRDFYWTQATDEYERHIDYTFEAPPAR